MALFLLFIIARRYASVVLADVLCPSVRPSVRPSVCLAGWLPVCPSDTRRYCINTASRKIKQLTPHDSADAKGLGEIRTRSHPKGAPMLAG